MNGDGIFQKKVIILLSNIYIIYFIANSQINIYIINYTQPASDNIYRLINCLLVSLYIGTLSFDYYKEIKSRTLRIKLWTFYIWIHSIISFSYFVEWVIDAHLNNNYESIIARWFTAIGCGLMILWAIPVFFQKKLKKFQLAILFISIMLYWWGSASLDCAFFADTADMTVMTGYQMLWTMALLILLESLPTMSTEIYVLGTELLIDQELDINLQQNTNKQMDLINVDDDEQKEEETVTTTTTTTTTVTVN